MANLSTIELFEEWKEFYFHKIGASTQQNYNAAWKYLSIYSDISFARLRTKDYQSLINNLDFLSFSSLKKIKQLAVHLSNYAIMEDIIRVNYAQFIDIPISDKCEKKIFSRKQVTTLFQYALNKRNIYWRAARITLILIFTGFRPSELFSLLKEDVNLKEGYFIGGAKTNAGRNRIVPVHPLIRAFVIEFYLAAAPSKKDTPSYLFKTARGKQLRLDKWRTNQFYPLMEELEINSTCLPPEYKPYNARHTFASLSYRAGVKPEILIKLMGHTSFKFTSEVYIHHDLQEFKKEISKIQLFD